MSRPNHERSVVDALDLDEVLRLHVEEHLGAGKIAKRLRVHYETAVEALDKALALSIERNRRNVPREAERLALDLEAQRERLWELDGNAGNVKDATAVHKTLVAVADRRAKLLGLDAPSELKLTQQAEKKSDAELEDDLRAAGWVTAEDLRAAVATEREACAVIAEAHSDALAFEIRNRTGEP